MSGHDIIVVGASAGGVEALTQFVRGLPADLPAALFVVLHVPPHGLSVLPQILQRAGPLPTFHPADGAPIESGRIYVAPPDHHLLLKRGHIHLTRGPRENSHRPAVDPLFRSAGQQYGPRVVGVVLSGMLDDGAAGLAAIKSRGGVAVVQDPDEALHPGMPRNALLNVEVDHVLPVADMPPLLVRLARAPVEEGSEVVPDDMDVENRMAELEPEALQEAQRPGTPTGFTCPECHGALWELRDDPMIRYRCRVGHAYSPDSLLAERSEALEAALWMALQALEESSALARRLAVRARERNHLLSAEQFEVQAADAQGRAECIRGVLLQPRPVEGWQAAALAPAAGGRS